MKLRERFDNSRRGGTTARSRKKLGNSSLPAVLLCSVGVIGAGAGMGADTTGAVKDGISKPLVFALISRLPARLPLSPLLCGSCGKCCKKLSSARPLMLMTLFSSPVSALPSSPMPVATTDTRITPSRFSSSAVPIMILASASTSFLMMVAASSTSCRVTSNPPVIFISTPRAPRMELISNSGFAIATSAASRARDSPSASPVPIIALPISCITVHTSAKSRLIRPG